MTRTKGKGKGKGKRETRYCCDCAEQGHIGVNCPYNWANRKDEEDDQASSWESEPEGENAEELAGLETHDEGKEWCWPKKGRRRGWRTERWDFDDGSAPGKEHPRPRPTDRQGASRAHDHTSTVQIMVRVLRDGTRGERTAQAIRCSRRLRREVPHVSMDYGFLGEKESQDRVSRVLVIRERRHKMTWAMLVPRKGTEFPWIAKRAAKFIDQLGHNRVALRCDNEPAIQALAREIAQARQEGSQTVPERPPVGESQRDHRVCGGPRCRPGQDTEGCTGAPHRGQSPARRKDIVLVGGVCGILDEQVRRRQGRKDTVAKTAQAKGQHTRNPGVWRKDPVHVRQTSERRTVGAAVPPRSVRRHAELIVRGSGCHRAGTGDQDNGERQESTRAGEMSDNAFNDIVQVGMERPAEMVPRDPGEVLMENKVARTYLRRADFEQWVSAKVVPGAGI